MKETYPLKWPDAWPRTRPQDRETRTAWKKSDRWIIDSLDTELKRFDVISAVLTRKDPHEIIGAPDPSVSLYFSRPRQEDFSWQDALGIQNPAPTAEEIKSAYRRLVAKYHTDNMDTGDLERFHAATKHRDNALAYVNRLVGTMHDFVIACDNFKTANWNITGIRNTIHSLRQMERDGTSALLHQALEGFKALPEGERGGA